MTKLSAFTKKEIVNINDGRRLGFLIDAEVNLSNFSLEAIVVSVPSKILPLGSDCKELVIPVEKIKKIGEDLILVNIEDRYLNVFLRGQTLRSWGKSDRIQGH